MSEAVPRYTVSKIDDMMLPDPVPDGEWVRAEDHDRALAAAEQELQAGQSAIENFKRALHLETLKRKDAEQAKLQAEQERDQALASISACEDRAVEQMKVYEARLATLEALIPLPVVGPWFRKALEQIAADRSETGGDGDAHT